MYMTTTNQVRVTAKIELNKGYVYCFVGCLAKKKTFEIFLKTKAQAQSNGAFMYSATITELPLLKPNCFVTSPCWNKHG